MFTPICGHTVKVDFDEYRAVHHITAEEVPIAFAAWLRELPDGEWDGDLRPLHPHPDTDEVMPTDD